LTTPVYLGKSGETESWLCYLQIIGLEDGYCRAVEQVSAFDAIISAAELIYHAIAPHEEFLATDQSIGFSGFSRIIPVLFATPEVNKMIDEILNEANQRKIHWLKKRK